MPSTLSPLGTVGSIDTFDQILMPESDLFRGRFLNTGTTGILLVAPTSYTLVATNPNQTEVAQALDDWIGIEDGDIGAVTLALDLLTSDQYSAAFDQIMPGFYASLTDISIEQAFAQTQMLNQRISSVRLGQRGFQVIGMQSQPLVYDKDGKSVADSKSVVDFKNISPYADTTISTHWDIWVLGTGAFARSINISQVPNYRNDAGGFLFGADYRWSENFVTGLYSGYQYSQAKYDGGGSTQGNSALFGTYASYSQGGYYVDAILGGAYTGYQTRRPIRFSTIDRTAQADPHGNQLTASLNIGKDWNIGNFTMGPIISAQYTYAGLGGFAENGADSLDLRLAQQNANSLRSTLGARVAYTWTVNEKFALIPEIRMFWQHEFLNDSRNINAALDGGGGSSFDFTTSNPYRDSDFAGVGVTAQIGRAWTASVFYNVNFGNPNYASNMVSAGLNFAF